MPVLDLVRRVAIQPTARVMQVQGMFDVPPSTESEERWHVDLPIEDRPWNIGLIVGPSGCGKSTVAREVFGEALVEGFDWPADRSVVDGFPAGMGAKEITAILSSVGFSSPPAWLRPFHVLSTGQQFRVTVARALAEPRDLAVIDEFTSVVDRTVAQVGSAAVASAVRRMNRKLVAVACHYDIIDWLQPDWLYEPATGQFQWRSLQRRPGINLTLFPVHRSAWDLFKKHHYMTAQNPTQARCYVAEHRGAPVAFASVAWQPCLRSGWRIARCVVLPDYQGAGIGLAVMREVASWYRATGKPVRFTAANPALIRGAARSKEWLMTQKPQRMSVMRKQRAGMASLLRTRASNRLVASFRYVGPANRGAAAAFGLLEPRAPAVTRRRQGRTAR